MNSISLPISAEKASDFARVAFHHNLVVRPTLEMIQEVRVVTMHPSGVPMLEFIAQDQSQTDEQKQRTSLRYADQFISRMTEGALIDINTGAIVDEKTADVVGQLAFFQRLRISDLKKMGLPVEEDPEVLGLLYALIKSEIGNIDARGGL